MTRTLVTMALPYANGSIHLGHLVEAVQTDCYVRALKAMEGADQVVFIGADDMHGTPIEVNARKAGVSPEEFVERFHVEHQRDYAAFEIGFTHFYKTHSEENRRHSEEIFGKLQADGAVEKRPVEQFYCEVDKRFLPDRFVKGTCPKCGAKDQYGDSCEVCGSTYDPTDLKDPRCVLCGTPPVRRSSEHYFVRLTKYADFLRGWTSKGTLQPEIKNYVDSWLAGGLKDWDISREAPYFGFKIPGETDKYFYVWMDAPIGYLSSTEHWSPAHYKDYWGKDSGARIEHFIGKDIIYFHTLFWPAMLHASGWNTPARIHVHGMLMVEGEKMSKTRGTFLNADTYLAAGLDPEWLRYFYAANLGTAPTDIDLSFSELKNRVNGELLNNVGNLANRALSVLSKSLEGRLGTLSSDEGLALWKNAQEVEARVGEAYRKVDLRTAIQEILALSTKANVFLQEKQPWKTLREQPEVARNDLTVAINIARVVARLIAPVVPRFAFGVEQQTGALLSWNDWTPLENKQIASEIKPLVRRVEDADIEKLTVTFAPKSEPTVPAVEQGKGRGKSKEAPAAAEPKPTAPGALEPEAGSRKPEAPSADAPTAEISIDQFGAIDLRAGKVLAAIKVPKKDRLIQLTVDLGEAAPRTIVSGVAQSYAPEELVGKMVVVVANLPPRNFAKGLASHGMILYSSGGARENTAVELPADVKPGSKVK